jgi:hypothetical protein
MGSRTVKLAACGWEVVNSSATVNVPFRKKRSAEHEAAPQAPKASTKQHPAQGSFQGKVKGTAFVDIWAFGPRLAVLWKQF